MTRFSHNYFLIVLLTGMAFTILGSAFVPAIVKPAFQGPDGVLWVSPLILWMGTLFTLWGGALVTRFSKKSLEWKVLSCGLLLLVGMFVFVASQRLTSGLRGLEAFQDFMGYRISIGNNIYSDPEKGVLGNHYTPFFFILSSIFYKILPMGFGYSRIVSMIATLGTSYLIFKLIKREKKSESLGMWGALLYLSTYGVMEKMYDWSQTDPLLTFFTFLSVWFFMKNTPRGDMWALLVGGLACFTKQHAIFAYMIVVVFALLSRRKISYYWPLGFWVAGGVFLIGITQGRAWEYHVGNPSSNDWMLLPHPEVLLRSFVYLAPLWVAAFICRDWMKSHRFVFFTAAVFFGSMAGVWKGGGWVNNLFPFIPLLCFMAVQNVRYLKWLWVLQFIIGLYNPFSTLYPWKTIRDVDRQMVDIGKQAKGEVWYPAQPYLAIPSGKPFWDDVGVLEAYCWAHLPAPKRIVDAIENQDFSYILLRKEGAFWFPVCHDIYDALQRNYSMSDSLGFVMYLPLSK